MINNSPAEYIFIRFCIFTLQAITPVSLAWTILRTGQFLASQQWHFSKALLPLDIWFAAETVFYLAVQRPFRAHIQKPAEHPPILDEKKRQEIFQRFTDNLNAKDAERHLRGWFKGARIEEIGREDVKSWLAWAFFEGRVVIDNPELQDYMLRLEQLLGKEFASGHGTAKPIRLTLDPILVGNRSLSWYLMVGFVDTMVYVKLSLYGFTHYRQSLWDFFTLFPFRPLVPTARHISPAKHLTYWVKPHTSKTRLPVVFVHGIGIGLYPYTPFLQDLNRNIDVIQPKNNDSNVKGGDDDGQIGILAIELMPICFRLTHQALSKPQFLHEIAAILNHPDHAEYASFVLVAHSYGSIVATHMFGCPEVSQKISSLVLIDPVCFLLHTPSVAYNFTIREPKKASEWQLWYFASRDWGVAHTLGRRFVWRENVLWREDVLASGKRCTVSLAERDLIVNTKDVGNYLALGLKDEEEDDEWKNSEWEGKQGLEVLWNKDKDHAQVFDKGWMRDRLVGVVREYTRKR